MDHDEALREATRWFADALSDGVTSEAIVDLIHRRPLVAGYVLDQAVEWGRQGLTEEQAAIVAASLKSAALRR